MVLKIFSFVSRNEDARRRGTKQKTESNQSRSIKQGRRTKKFILSHWWTSVIWRKPNWRQSTKKCKGRVVLRNSFVKNDSGSYARFTEKGSSASQMTAATNMDIISRLSGCAGKAAGAASFFFQVKKNVPKLLKIRKSECPDIWIRLPRHKWHKSLSSMEDPVVPLERNLHGYNLEGQFWEKQIDENPFEIRLGQDFQLRIFLRTQWKKKVILICVCGWNKNWLIRNKTLIRCGKYSIKKLIWENQHLSLIMSTWDVLKDNVI